MWPLVAIGIGIGALLLLKSGGQSSQPPPPPPPPPPSPPLPPSTVIPAAIVDQPTIQPMLAPQGYGAEVYKTYNPSDSTVSSNVRAMRFLGLTGLLPSDVSGNASNPDYQSAVKAFQGFASLPTTGTMDPTTQQALAATVQARNAQVHSINAAANLQDTDWVTNQNNLGAQDPRGAWNVNG